MGHDPITDEPTDADTGGFLEMADSPRKVELTPDVTFELLSNARRRYALAYLSRRGQPMTIEGLARQIAAWETDTPVSDVDETSVERVMMTLHHNHIPKLRAAGLVEKAEREEGYVLEPTDRVNEVEAELSMGLDNAPTRHYTT